MRDRIIVNLLTDFAREFELSDLSEDRQFEHFAAHITVHRHYGRTFNTSNVLTGSATGIDALAILANGVLISDVEMLEQLAEQSDYLDVLFVFVQADRSPKFDGGKLGTFAFAVKDLFEPGDTPLKHVAEIGDASEIISAIYDRFAGKLKNGNPLCRLYYVTTGKAVPDPIMDARRSVEIAALQATDLFKSVSINLIGSEEVRKLYYQTKNAISREFVFSNSIPIPEISGITEAYVGLLPAQDLVALVKDEDGDILRSIFDDNVRDWQEYNRVNTEIKSTLQSADRSRFALMNNGVTIIARAMRKTAQKMQIEDFQIVNGCQTCHVLFDQQGDLDETVMVPLRLIATADEGITNSIIRATNRQTTVTEEQFFAITEFPRKLELYFATFPEPQRLYYERRSKQYGRLAVEKTRIVTQADLLKAFAAMFIGEPHATTRSIKRLSEKMGTDIFAVSHRLEPYYVSAFAAYLLEWRFRNGRTESAYKPARFHILLAIRLLANPATFGQMGSHDMGKYCDGIMEILWDSARSDELFVKAAEIISDLTAGDLDRDKIRTVTFTDAMMERCGGRPPQRPHVTPA